MKTISIVGTVGVPANYGGFETLVENLLIHHQDNGLKSHITIYCSSKRYAEKRLSYLGANLKYMPLDANGAQSVIYDIVCLISAVLRRSDVILLLGVSGAAFLPIVRIISSAKIVTNIDGIEWRREKWGVLARRFLRLSEKLAVRYSHDLIADNAAIATYIGNDYGRTCTVIGYGGDNALSTDARPLVGYKLPAEYAFCVCRIEPENNIDLILSAFSHDSVLPLVMVGNWKASHYGTALVARYKNCSSLHLLDPIYDMGILRTLRSNCTMYVHGHSAGGTNPSLVEAMHFGRPIACFDCAYNRETTENYAYYFQTLEELRALVRKVVADDGNARGKRMMDIAKRRYVWREVAGQYFELIG